MKYPVAALCVGMFASSILGAGPLSAATEQVVYSFCSRRNCTDGRYPWAGVLRVRDQLYTTTTSGGGTGTNQGTLVAVNRKTGAADVVYSFERRVDDAAEPQSGLIDVNGTLYGTTAGGGSGDDHNGAGTIYSVNRKSGRVKVLYSFCTLDNCADGALPTANLFAVNGILYGATLVGGGGTQDCYGPYPGCGTVFSFDPTTGVEKVLYEFCSASSCTDGSRPRGSLIEVNGALYGTTSGGGDDAAPCSDMGLGCGVVYALDPTTGAETVLHTFAGRPDGGSPAAGLVDVNGTLYGTTEYGGGSSACESGYGCGTIFSIDPTSGALTIGHSFQNDGTDGQDPMGWLIQMGDKLYGTTRIGGAHADGTVFSFDPGRGKEKVLYAFCSQQRCNDGAGPYAGLTEVRGKLYGTTVSGGTGDPDFASGGGTIFMIKS